jgi:hypothetical protein
MECTKCNFKVLKDERMYGWTVDYLMMHHYLNNLLSTEYYTWMIACAELQRNGERVSLASLGTVPPFICMD